MAVITGLQANIGDLDSFLGAWEGTSSRLASYGATESRCVQIMMAGELSGRFNIANQWNDIDAAMTGCADNVADSATQSAMSAAGGSNRLRTPPRWKSRRHVRAQRSRRWPSRMPRTSWS